MRIADQALPTDDLLVVWLTRCVPAEGETRWLAMDADENHLAATGLLTGEIDEFLQTIRCRIASSSSTRSPPPPGGAEAPHPRRLGLRPPRLRSGSAQTGLSSACKMAETLSTTKEQTPRANSSTS